MERMNPEVDEALMISQYYLDLDGIYTQFLPEQGVGVGAAKPRRRRSRKNILGGGEVVMRKRKLSEKQVKLLEESFGSEQKLESERKERLAAELGLDPRQVAVWFQNRRARWKAKKLEEEYSNLKSHLDAAVLHKCRLETELLKLKEQLHEAEKEIQRLSSSSEENNSPCSSFTMDPPHPFNFVGEFGVEHDYGFHTNYAHDHGIGIGIEMEWDTPF